MGNMKENVKLNGNESASFQCLVSKEEKESAIKNRDRAVKEWRKRRKMCMDIVNAIMESYPKSKKELMEEIGMETEEEAGINMKKGI